jgi:haloacetate dehalogenase
VSSCSPDRTTSDTRLLRILFEGFGTEDVDTPRGRVHARVGGSGPPLLLLHGYPETHLMWHGAAAPLAAHFTVVAPDLPGYGDSFRPPISGDHASHGKRALATDLVAAMRALGHEAFVVAGHDRGGRIAYRMALDHPAAVTRLAVLDIVPTGEVWSHANADFAMGYWHWPFLAQPAPLPERLILGDPDGFWLAAERIGLGARPGRYPQEVIDAYRGQLSDPEIVSAICEDYRAGATVDRELDDSDLGRRTIVCPVLALWGANGALPRFYDDPLQLWRPYATDLIGHGVEGASHFLAEDAPDQIAAELIQFFR